MKLSCFGLLRWSEATRRVPWSQPEATNIAIKCACMYAVKQASARYSKLTAFDLTDAAVYKEEIPVHTWGLLLYLSQTNKASMGT
ncbi:hypothetical protein COLO4_35442 [Corchorus olitorius]|uniref:Uncharacterized protein n=1 Tax=Corchorus olitorius TaxID=93759 RepID=A0A1R3GGW0_9ROSI|nr:hypothetical protein COLO4_35442 [Corchorus olitorius]